MYKILISRNAKKSLDKIRGKDYSRISDKIKSLANEPRPVGCLKLTDSEGYRIRTGNYRILYFVDDGIKIVSIERIIDRKDAYK